MLLDPAYSLWKNKRYEILKQKPHFVEVSIVKVLQCNQHRFVIIETVTNPNQYHFGNLLVKESSPLAAVSGIFLGFPAYLVLEYYLVSNRMFKFSELWKDFGQKLRC